MRWLLGDGPIQRRLWFFPRRDTAGEEPDIVGLIEADTEISATTIIVEAA